MEKMYKQMPVQVHADCCGASKGADLSGIVPLMGYGEGLPAPLIYRKGWALLGYLALEPNRMHSRASLAALFWPNLGETSARCSATSIATASSSLARRYCRSSVAAWA